MNLVDLIKGQLGGDAVGKIASYLGEDGDTTKSALGAAVPAILAGLAGSASTPDGARKLSAAVDGADDSIMGSLGNMLGSGGSSMIERSTGMLGSLLGGGNALSGLGNVLSRFTGLGGKSITSLLGMLLPVILGMLKKQKSSLGLDGSGLANLLSSQKANIAAAMPAGLGDMLSSTSGVMDSARAGASNAYNAARDTYRDSADTVRRGTHAVAAAAPNPAKWAIPLVILLGLGALVWWAASRRAPEITTTPPAPSPSIVERQPDPAIDRAQTASDTLAGAAASQIASLKDDLGGVFTSATDIFTNIKDAASAEAALPKLQDLNTKLDGARRIYDAIPAEARTTLSSWVSTSQSQLKPLIDKAMSIPGVGDKLRPVVDKMTASLKSLAGI